MSRLAIHSFAADEAPARRLAARLGVPYAAISLHSFPDGEVMPSVPVRPARTVVLYQSLYRPRDKLIPLLLAADAYGRLGTERLILAAPYLPYLRQDKVFHPGQPLSRDVIAGWLGSSFHRILTVQAHAHRTKDLSAVFRTPVDNLPIGATLAALFDDDGPRLVVGPDEESLPGVEAAAAELRAEAAVFHKTRSGDRDVALHMAGAQKVRGKAVLLVDDVCSSGGTLLAATRQLKTMGAVSIDVAVAHALFDDATTQALKTAGVRRLVSSDSIPHPSNALSLAGTFAAALSQELVP